jgi:predicted Zn-dependent peptidase
MGYWLPAMTAERLRAQQEVVVNEKRQRYENVPYGAERFAIAAGLYPEGHPHRYLGIGQTEHILAATLAEVQAFYRTWYVPANATLVVAGDVEIEDAFARVERFFGSFPASARPARQDAHAEVTAPVSVAVPDQFAALRRIHRAWLGPRVFAAGEPELDLATAAWTAVGTGPLWRALVYETQLAQRVSAWTVNSRLGGEIHVAVDLQTGADAARVRAILDAELAVPLDRAALDRQVTRREAATIWALTGLVRRAQMLHRYALYTDDADGLAADLARYRTVTPESTNAAVARWVRPEAMVEVETLARA